MMESNAENTWAQARSQKAEPVLGFCCAFAEKMLTNSVDHNRRVVAHIQWPLTQRFLEMVKMEHTFTLEKQPRFT